VSSTSSYHPIGQLKWEIEEVPTGQLISSGERAMLLRDMTIERRGDAFYKGVQLGGGFTFGISEFPLKDHFGFGFTAEYEREHVFSWEWFTIDGPDHATKLQEAGEMNVRLMKTPNGEEVLKTEFLTDVSFRVSRFGSAQPGVAHWRIKIFAGSMLAWPYLAAGEIRFS
jgi:hypothetical protein